MTLAALIGASSCESRKEHSRKEKDSTEIKEKSETAETPSADVKMTDVDPTPAEVIDDYSGNENYRKLMLIAAKCDKPDFSLEDLSQSDYTFMIDFCNHMMDAAEEADMAGQSDEFIEEAGELVNLMEGFLQFLSMAYEGGYLDTRNTHDVELMVNRINRLAE